MERSSIRALKFTRVAPQDTCVSTVAASSRGDDARSVVRVARPPLPDVALAAYPDVASLRKAAQTKVAAQTLEAQYHEACAAERRAGRVVSAGIGGELFEQISEKVGPEMAEKWGPTISKYLAKGLPWAKIAALLGLAGAGVMLWHSAHNSVAPSAGTTSGYMQPHSENLYEAAPDPDEEDLDNPASGSARAGNKLYKEDTEDELPAYHSTQPVGGMFQGVLPSTGQLNQFDAALGSLPSRHANHEGRRGVRTASGADLLGTLVATPPPDPDVVMQRIVRYVSQVVSRQQAQRGSFVSPDDPRVVAEVQAALPQLVGQEMSLADRWVSNATPLTQFAAPGEANTPWQ